MGQKVNPFIFRVILNRNWNSSWFIEKKNFSNFLIEDIKIRDIINRSLKDIPFGKTIIQKSTHAINIILYVKKKISLIYDYNINILNLKKDISKYVNRNINLIIRNVSDVNIDVALIYNKIKNKIQYRKPYKNIIKNIIDDAFKSHAWGVKIIIKGRLAGSIMTKKQIFKQGKIPLHQISSNIKYFNGAVNTSYGSVGIKIWICMGNLIYY